MDIVNSTGEIRPASPNKVMQYWATQRQNMKLLYRAKIDESTIDRYRAELQGILEQPIITYPPILEKLGLQQDFTFIEKKEALGLEKQAFQHNKYELEFMEFMQQKQLQTRKLNWRWRITQEVEEKNKLGWYPFFVTLTLDPTLVEKYYESTKEFWQEGREFRKYIRRLSKIVTREVGHPPAHKKTKEFNYRSESDYVTYVGIIEHGKSREHHHAHFLIWLREIPSRWKQDPNRYIRNPENRTNRECKELSAYWHWSRPGLSPANYFRVKGDIWSRLDHGYPLDSKNRQVIKVGGAAQSAGYVTKYLQKDHKEWHHRVKATRNLGLKRLKQTISNFNLQQCIALTWRPENSKLLHLASLTHSAPLALVRSIAKQAVFCKQLAQSLLDLRTLMTTNSIGYLNMIQSVRSGIRPSRMRSADFYDWVCRHQSGQKGYCEKKLIEAHKLLSIEYPRNNIEVEPITLGANNFGPSLII